MMLRIARYFKGGVSYQYLENLPISEVMVISDIMLDINKREQNEINNV